MSTKPFHVDFPVRLAEPLAIAHVTVVPMDEEHLLPDYTVVIEDGFIRAMGPSSEINTDDMRIVDGSRKYLMPGLADMHVHFEDSSEFAMFLANGVTLVRQMWGSSRHLAWERKVQRGELPGPHVVPTSPIIDGANRRGHVVHAGSVLLTDPAGADGLVAGYAASGYRQIKVYSLLSRETLQALGRASSRYGLRMVGHCPQAVTFEEAIAAGMSCFEHLTAIANGHLLQDFDLRNFSLSRMELLSLETQYIDYAAIHRLAQQMAKEQIWNCPTIVVWQGLNHDHATLIANPLLRYMPPMRKALWRKPNEERYPDASYSTSERLAIGRAWNDMRLRIVSILHEEGVPLLLGTDTPNPHVYQGFSLHDELANFVQAGLSPYEALCCGTSEAARFLDESALWGTIATGKRADLLLMRANPLNDVGAVRDLEAVFVNGFYFARHDLDMLLEQRSAFTQNLPIAIPIELEPVDGGGEVIRHETLKCVVGSIERDRLTYRYTRFKDGSWLVEECCSESGHGKRTSMLLWLGSDGSLQRGEIHVEELMGDEVWRVERSDQGEYILHRQEVDGQQSHMTLGSVPLVPNLLLSLSAIPLLLSLLKPVEGEIVLPSLGLGRDGIPAVAKLVFSRSAPENQPDEGSVSGWKVTTEWPGAAMTRTYQLASDGSLLAIKSDIGTWRGAWEPIGSK
jgi:hypothetical protein